MDQPTTCATCRFWGLLPTADAWRERDIADEHPGYRVCGAIADETDGNKYRSGPWLVPALAIDAEGYWARLATRSDFGCRLHEPSNH